MKLPTQLTGLATLLIIGVAFVLGDVVMFLVLTPIVRLRPSKRQEILGRFAQLTAKTVTGVLRHVGRAHIQVPTVIPPHGGVLLVMNHQSLIDIPAAVTCLTSGYPRMVSRARYGRGIPLVSYMISLYGHILVQPGRMGRSELDALAETARTSTLPILIYPEGHRTRDGEIRPWKRGGLDTFLSARDWEVYVLVVDGLWRVAHLTDFLRDLSHVRCRVEVVGPFRYDGRGRESHDAFVTELRGVMVDRLAEMRAAAIDSQRASSLVLSDP
jgi:1-acyl-sn-glycerol-3-phosphate acyltransferase